MLSEYGIGRAQARANGADGDSGAALGPGLNGGDPGAGSPPDGGGRMAGGGSPNHSSLEATAAGAATSRKRAGYLHPSSHLVGTGPSRAQEETSGGRKTEKPKGARASHRGAREGPGREGERGECLARGTLRVMGWGPGRGSGAQAGGRVAPQSGGGGRNTARQSDVQFLDVPEEGHLLQRGLGRGEVPVDPAPSVRSSAPDAQRSVVPIHGLLGSLH